MPKTIFGTTEKSNFILNMGSNTLQKWIHGVLIFCIIFPLIGAAVLCGSEHKTYLSGAFLYATGFTCVLFFLIVLLKKDLLFKDNKSYVAIVIMAVLGLATYYVSYFVTYKDFSAVAELNAPLLGNIGRQEGYLAVLSYFGIFLLATTVSKQSAVKNVFDVLIGAGIVQSVVAILQHIPGLGFPSDYRDLSIILVKNVFLSSGFTDSPIFYGAFMTLVSGIAITGAVYEKNKIRAEIYGVSAVLFFVTSLFTSSIIPFIGIGSVLVLLIVVQFINAKKGNAQTFEAKLLKTPASRMITLIAALAAAFAVIFFTQGINLSDMLGKVRISREKSIAFYDSFFRLFSGSAMSPRDPSSLYKLAWGDSIDVIKKYPLLGAGFDCFGYALSLFDRGSNFTDKSYNEYLYIAATRGIPALLVYLALIVFSIKRMCGKLSQFFADSTKWFRPALFVAVTAYLIQAFFNASTITVAPFFWLLLGLTWSNRLDSDTGSKAVKAKKK
jgi:hypothetical protein